MLVLDSNSGANSRTTYDAGAFRVGGAVFAPDAGACFRGLRLSARVWGRKVGGAIVRGYHQRVCLASCDVEANATRLRGARGTSRLERQLVDSRIEPWADIGICDHVLTALSIAAHKRRALLAPPLKDRVGEDFCSR